MSNKDWNKLNPLDVRIRRALNLGMSDGTFLKIEFIYGFEKFNTRPYHNYETWAGGYRVTDEHNGITLEREDLDDAVEAWAQALGKRRASATSVAAVDPVGELAKRDPSTRARV